MAITKRIICLANSRKLNGRCVAGRELVQDKPEAWIRPVRFRPHEGLSYEERRYQDNSEPLVLDIMDVHLRRANPEGYQTENWLIEPHTRWARTGQYPFENLRQLADERGPLWLNDHSTYNGRNDQIPVKEAATLKNSLMLIHVDSIRLRLFKPGEAFGDPERRVQAWFRFDGNDYGLMVTDLIIRRKYFSQEDGDYQLGEGYLTVSIGEPYKGNCYKLVAAVIQQA